MSSVVKNFFVWALKDNYTILGCITILYTSAIVFFAYTGGLDFDYGAYMILRWLVFLFAGWTMYKIYRDNSKSRLLLLFGSMVIFFNPIFKITLERPTWILIDIFTLIVLVVWLLAPAINEIKNKSDGQTKGDTENITNSIFSQNSFTFVKNFFPSTTLFIATNRIKTDENELAIVRIFAPELTFHILALFINILRSKYGGKFEEEIAAFKDLLCGQINHYYKEHFLISYDEDYIADVIENRCKILFGENDMKTRNRNFLNICHKEVKTFENKNDNRHFEIFENVNLTRIQPRDPFNMTLLPSAYKTGFVDKGLDSFAEVLSATTKEDIQISA